MKYLKHYLPYICLFAFSILANAQQFSITQVPSYDRLPVAGVNCLLQDEEGYMWYGTNQAGLCRDDGYQIMTFGYNAAPEILSNPDVLCMGDAGNQRIWFGTREGLYILDKHSYKISVANEELAHRRMSDLACAKDGTVWAVSSSHIYHMAPDGTMLATYESMQGDSPRTTNDIYVDSHNTVWVTQWKGELLRMKSGEKVFKPVNDMSGLNAFCIVEDTLQNCYYVGTWGSGIYILKENGESVEPSPIKEGFIASLLLDNRRGILWATTYNQGVQCYGFFENGLEEMETLYDDQLHMPMIIGKMIEDRFENPWVPGYSVNTFAICHSNNRMDSRKITVNDGTFDMPVVIDVVDAGKNAWLLRESGGVSCYDFAKDYSEKLTFCSDTAVIAPAPNGHVFVVNKDRRIYDISKSGSDFESQYMGRLGFNANVLLYSEADKLLYIGGKNGSLAVGNGKDDPRVICDSLGWIFKICESVDMSSLYLLTYTKGILRLDKNMQDVEVLVPNDYRFSDIAVSASGAVWASSNIGKLYSIEKGRAVECPQFSTPNGEAIQKLVFDELDHLWLMSKNFVRETDVTTGAVRTIYANDNQLGMHAFENISASEGGVTICGVGGIARVKSSSDINKPGKYVRIAVSEYSYGNKRFVVNYGQNEIVIPADSSDYVSISLTSFDYLKAENSEFKFKIEGVNKEWVKLKRGDNEIHMQKVAKGTYKVWVMTTDAFGYWCDPVELLTIRRLPAWWESWWAYVIYTILVLLLIYGIWRFNREMHERRLRFEYLLGVYHELEKKVEEYETDTMQDEDEDVSTDEMDDNKSEEVSFFNDQLLQKAISTIEKNIANEDYSVDEFASDMCMSRMTLYRKIYAASGQTPSDLLRSYRLDKAAKMLRSTTLSVVEISEKVGFSSPRYFSVCFKKKYGVLPKDFRN